MNHVKLITEMYNKNPEYETNSFGWKVPVRSYVDDVFDHISYIYCNEKHISEKSFGQLDDADSYIKDIFDNNPEIIEEINNLKDKRIEYTAEVIYDRYFKNVN